MPCKYKIRRGRKLANLKFRQKVKVKEAQLLQKLKSGSKIRLG